MRVRMSVIEIGSVFHTSRFNPYREPHLVFLQGEFRSFSESAQPSLSTLDTAAVVLRNVHAHSRLIRVKGRRVYVCFQSTRPEFYASVFKRDNPAVNISRCILYTREDESLFEKKKYIFTSKTGSKEVPVSNCLA